MKQIIFLLVYTLFFISNSTAQSPESKAGPVFENYGKVYPVPEPDFPASKDIIYRVLFDIYDSPENPEQLNAQINTLARFYNMHVQAGVPLENLEVACVFHNKASWDAANSEQYKEKYGVDNPNEVLLEALSEVGARIFICGQSLYARGLDRERLAEPVKVGLSAMTIILSLQQEGYVLIKF